MTDLTLGEKVRVWRDRRGFTQEELAVACGVRKNTITRIENGAIKNPSSVTLEKIATALRLTTDYLLGRSQTPKQSWWPAGMAYAW